MITSRHIEKIVAVITAAAVILCLLAAVFSNALEERFGGGIAQEYETALFDRSSVIRIDIQMDGEKWNEMLENAINEEYYQCDVVVNGTTFYNVGIRPKGNSSLSSIYNDDTTDRYSFKLEFDKYVDGQTCFGLDKLVLNDNYSDATNMKEAVVFDMFRYLGADASLCNYADISVNGETWGVYLALEAVEESFMLRNYGATSGNLYKPDSENMNGGGAKEMNRNPGGEDTDFPAFDRAQAGEKPDFTPPEGEEFTMPSRENMPGRGDFAMPSGEDIPETDEMPQGGKNFGNMGGMSGKSTNGADLNYIDDDADSYSAIWDGEVTSTNTADKKRVITALKNISEQNNVEDYLDVDNMLKYLAVHTFVVNLDSLSGSMAHNYYLYEYNGRLNMLPWDYNLAFGSFSRGSSSTGDAINFAIDTPFSSGITLDDRQFFAALLENDEYLEQYHEYLRILCEEYIDGGELQAFYDSTRSLIDELVRNDPTAFYSYDEYNSAAETLLETISLRTQSVEGQLSGEIPSTNEGQQADSSSLIDASGLELGGMGGFGGMAGGKGQRPENAMQAQTDGSDNSATDSNNGTTDNAINNNDSNTGGSDTQDTPNSPDSSPNNAADEGTAPVSPPASPPQGDGMPAPPQGMTPPDSANGGGAFPEPDNSFSSLSYGSGKAA